MIKLINTYLRPYRGFLALILIFQTVATIASLSLPNLNASIIDDGVATADTAQILRYGAIMIGFSLLNGAASILAVYFSARAAMGLGRDMRRDLFDRVLGFSTRELNHFGAPSLLTRNTNDVQQVQMMVFMVGSLMISAPIMMAGSVVMALREDRELSWLILVAVLVLGIFIGFLVSRLLPLFNENQDTIDNLNRVTREQITGIRVIRAFVRESVERHRFAGANRDLMTLAIKIATWFAMLFPFVNLVMNLSSASVMWFGGQRVDSGAILIGTLTAFITYLMQILISVMIATMLVMMAPRAAVCATRIREVLSTPSSVVPPTRPVDPAERSGRVVFDEVSFSYPGAGEPVLSKISFTMEPGTTTAIIGSTGSGKTTLINLIPRLFDVQGGRVLVDGVNVTDYEPEQLWSRIGLVPQKPYLFSGTIRSTLEYGLPGASDDDCWQALRIAQADDFVSALPAVLEAPVAQGGTNFSGGQRQRLSIARALVKKPEIYIFDDAFSALDVTTDAKLRAALADHTHDASVLIVGQRISTIKDADQILVLDHGTIVGKGTHDELLASCQTYQEIVESQRTVQEAA